jgi:hypothetical protein
MSAVQKETLDNRKSNIFKERRKLQMIIEYTKPCVGSSLSEAASHLQADEADCDLPVIATAAAVASAAAGVAAAAVQVYTIVTSH